MRDNGPLHAPIPDLEICAREPIQFAGAIEPHGLLLVFSTPDFQIVQASVNTHSYLGITPETLLGMRATDIFAREDVDELTKKVRNEGKRRYVGGLSIAACEGQFDALVHMQQELLIIELEPQSAAKIGNDAELYASLTAAMSEFDKPAGLSDLCQRIATSIRRVTGFDGLMVYRFLEDDSAFACSASHDPLEPLRAISAYSQLAMRAERGDTQRIREFLSIVHSNAGRMAALIKNLLAYSEIGGSARAERTPVNLEDVLGWALLNLEELVGESGAIVTHDPLPVIPTNQDHMVQVLQNLISNAVKYRRAGQPPRIHLSAVLEGDSWLFAMRDNGQGFAPEYTKLIFDPFQRLHGREIPGTGIGLAICKRIVELNGGRIWATSDGKDCGATFWYTAPASHPDQMLAANVDALLSAG